MYYTIVDVRKAAYEIDDLAGEYGYNIVISFSFEFLGLGLVSPSSAQFSLWYSNVHVCVWCNTGAINAFAQTQLKDVFGSMTFAQAIQAQQQINDNMKLNMGQKFSKWGLKTERLGKLVHLH